MFHYWTFGLLMVLVGCNMGGAILRQNGTSHELLINDQANKLENLDRILVKDFKSLQKVSDENQILKLVVDQDISKVDSSSSSISKSIAKQRLDVVKHSQTKNERNDNLNKEKLKDKVPNSINAKEIGLNPLLVYPTQVNKESGCT